MRRPLVLLSAAVLSLGLFAPVAGAAVPQWKPDVVLPCDGGQVKLWMSRRHLAAKNTCDTDWLVMGRTPWDNGGSKTTYYSLAPGAHFNWSGWDWSTINVEGGARFWYYIGDGPKTCTDWSSSLILKGSHGKTVSGNAGCD